jgi:hypothetical protein
MGLCATPEMMRSNEVALGDEVFVSGLFRHHYGTNRNIPIVRVGNLAAMDEEKVSTRTLGLIDAYLIEARSTGGLSGSPVFVNLGIHRMIGGKIKQVSGDRPMFFLLGLVHGHYDIPLGDAGTGSNESVNAGIAIVVPFIAIQGVVEAFEAKMREAFGDPPWPAIDAQRALMPPELIE